MNKLNKVKVTWPILGISALHLTHPKCTHTAVNTHREHTPGAVGSHVPAPGEQSGVRCLAQGHLSRGIEEERALVIHTHTHTPSPPLYNSCRTWDSNPRPLDYESNSLTIRPRLPLNIINKSYYVQTSRCEP